MLKSSEDNIRFFEVSEKVGNRYYKITGFGLQKNGNTENEYEDSYAIGYGPKKTFRVAIADGATESIFSNVWANLLTKEYVLFGINAIKADGLFSSYQKFISHTNEKIKDSPDLRQWLLYEKIEKGTHATFAGIEFSDSFIKITTIGDSCIFWKNNEENNVCMQPSLNPEEFDSFPQSICHLPDTWQYLDQHITQNSLPINKAIQIVLCTDALACCLVNSLQKEILWKKLLQVSQLEDFKEVINQLRDNKKLNNDDVTLVTINALPIDV